jgi:hypothetical protein
MLHNFHLGAPGRPPWRPTGLDTDKRTKDSVLSSHLLTGWVADGQPVQRGLQ